MFRFSSSQLVVKVVLFLPIFAAPLFLLSSAVPNQLVISARGQMYYYGGEKRMDLYNSERTCSFLGGRLPIIHSRADSIELVNMTGDDVYVWLAVRSQDWTSPEPKLRHYKWTDGSPFDFTEWTQGHPTCTDSCCGISLYKGLFYDEPCHVQNQFICLLPQLTEKAHSWLKNTLSILNYTLTTDNSVVNLEQQVSINDLNQSVLELQSSNSLNFRVNICLVLLFLVIFVQVLIVTKINLLDFLPLGLSNTYSRFFNQSPQQTSENGV